jgi:xylan 1,4-beta-xylosidase
METIALKEKTIPFPHTWETCIGAGRANEGLRADWQKQLRFISETCGFKMIRFHGLFHDDMFVVRLRENTVVYNWQYVDTLFDAVLDCGMKPFVELGFCPTDLSSGTKTQFWWKGNITPPKKYEEWGTLIEALVTHLQKRYGAKEIEGWNFEVWNEPNLKAFWDGTRSQYFNLYKTSVQVIKKINANISVGGPATSNFVPDDRFSGEKEDTGLQTTFTSNLIDEAVWKPVWIREFLFWCKEENLPVDFISCHPYPTDFAFDVQGEQKGLSRKVSATLDDLKTVDSVIKECGYPSVKRYFTEWSSSPTSRDCSHDFMPAAVYVTKIILEGLDFYDCLSYWTFTDIFEEEGAGDSAFHGGFGMINLQGIPKPVWHAFRLMHVLGTKKVYQKEGLVVTATDNDKLSALLYNYPESYTQTIPIHYYPDFEGAQAVEKQGEPKYINQVFSGLQPNAIIELEYVDAQNGCAMGTWNQMGRPSSPSKKEIELLKKIASTTKTVCEKADASGTYHLHYTMQAWSLLAIREL